jgi:diguanylate cyclase (GGDEF)-like protein
MIDVDHFKQFNDAYGHVAGDEALRHVTSAITRALRAEDALARFGGEEFVVVARAADGSEARALAERLRSGVASLRVEEETPRAPVVSVPPLTVSVGVALLSELDPTDHATTTLIGLADQRLYGAKLHGRNQVCSED